MPTPNPIPEAPETRTAGALEHSSQDDYTGVVVIHGIGDIKRSDTLQEAVNALTYWFNHVAGLALRPDGAGRVWLTTSLTDDPNPDAPPSRATLELQALGAGQALSLKFREVWWADSFGPASIPQTIRWARLQFRVESARLLIPVGRRSGPAYVAARSPARETSQALTHTRAGGVPGREPTGQSASSGAARRPLAGRALLRILLGLYGVLQYIWKAVLWLALTPLITAVLLLIGVARLFSFIPFIRSATLATLVAFTNYIMLHWVACMQAYLLDYTRSSAMRQRFEREVEFFLRDEHCTRLVVIAHSMGTVIAYEGLTTIFARPEWRDETRPLTFICLAQALRRIWLLEDVDPHRIRGVLPERVRWLHFWARYDPVAAGPLDPQALPRLSDWADPEQPVPDQAIIGSLARCENVDVVNTDSTLADHTTYWQNLEQVVGPIARELVAGYPQLEAVAATHLATDEDILWRRWRVAWRASISLFGGLAAGIAIILLDAHGAGVGHLVHLLLQSIRWSSIVSQWCTNLGMDPNVCTAPISSGPTLNHFAQDISHGLVSVGVAIPFLVLYLAGNPDLIFTAGTALAVTALGMLGLARVVAMPSPFAFHSTPGVAPRSASIFALTALALLLLGSAYVVTGTTGSQATSYFYGFPLLAGLAELIGVVAVLAGLAYAARNRQWTALAALALGTLVPVVATPATFHAYLRDFEGAYFAVAAAACVAGLLATARQGQWGGFVALWVALLLAFYTSGSALLHDHARLLYDELARTAPQLVTQPVAGADSYFPILTFGIWAAFLHGQSRRGTVNAALRAAAACAVLALAFYAAYSGVRTYGSVAQADLSPAIVLLRWAGDAAGALAWLFCAAGAAAGRRWIGLGAVLVAGLGVAALLWREPSTLGVGLLTITFTDGLWFMLVQLKRAQKGT